MLVLTRREEQKIVIRMGTGEVIEIVVAEVRRNKVRIGIDAPPDARISRPECRTFPVAAPAVFITG